MAAGHVGGGGAVATARDRLAVDDTGNDNTTNYYLLKLTVFQPLEVSIFEICRRWLVEIAVVGKRGNLAHPGRCGKDKKGRPCIVIGKAEQHYSHVAE